MGHLHKFEQSLLADPVTKLSKVVLFIGIRAYCITQHGPLVPLNEKYTQWQLLMQASKSVLYDTLLSESALHFDLVKPRFYIPKGNRSRST